LPMTDSPPNSTVYACVAWSAGLMVQTVTMVPGPGLQPSAGANRAQAA
jgi:hypothetical protein